MSRTNPILIAAVAGAAALAAFWFLLLAPQREKADALEARVVLKETELRDAEAKVVEYEQARGSYRANYGRLVRLGKAVPADDDVRSLVVSLETAAHRTGVDFRRVVLDSAGSTAPASTPSAPASTSTTTPGAAPASTATPPPGAVAIGTAGFSAMPFQFTFRGSYHNLSGFFARLERFVTASDRRLQVTGRLLRVESVNLQVDEGKGWPYIKAEIGASSYLVPPTEGLLAGATPQGPAASTVATPGAAPATQSAGTSGATTSAVPTPTATGGTQ